MEEQKTEFKVTNDNEAEWALDQIREVLSERDRLIEIAKNKISELNSQIDALNEKYENKTSYLKGLLGEYFMTVKHKETKTQESYQLLTAKLVMKKPSVKIVHDDEKLMEIYDGTELIDIKKSFKWGEFKKDLKIMDDGSVVDTVTGEVVDACKTEPVPGEFKIDFSKEEQNGQ